MTISYSPFNGINSKERSATLNRGASILKLTISIRAVFIAWGVATALVASAPLTLTVAVTLTLAASVAFAVINVVELIEAFLDDEGHTQAATKEARMILNSLEGIVEKLCFEYEKLTDSENKKSKSESAVEELRASFDAAKNTQNPANQKEALAKVKSNLIKLTNEIKKAEHEAQEKINAKAQKQMHKGQGQISPEKHKFTGGRAPDKNESLPHGHRNA
jgi:Skp family chaperone for outer membrane proteins